jgi:hypothetical protein
VGCEKEVPRRRTYGYWEKVKGQCNGGRVRGESRSKREGRSKKQTGAAISAPSGDPIPLEPLEPLSLSFRFPGVFVAMYVVVKYMLVSASCE